VPRDGYQGWTRAKERAWERVFAPKREFPAFKELMGHLNDQFAEKVADDRTKALHANRCVPPCKACKCKVRQDPK
jgi:hypothetical protein